MDIDERKTLILQFNDRINEWEDITKQVQWYDATGNACRIKYIGNSNFYWKSWRGLKILNNPKSIDITGKIVYLNKVPVNDLSEIIAFDSYIKLFYANKFTSGNARGTKTFINAHL